MCWKEPQMWSVWQESEISSHQTRKLLIFDIVLIKTFNYCPIIHSELWTEDLVCVPCCVWAVLFHDTSCWCGKLRLTSEFASKLSCCGSISFLWLIVRTTSDPDDDTVCWNHWHLKTFINSQQVTSRQRLGQHRTQARIHVETTDSVRISQQELHEARQVSVSTTDKLNQSKTYWIYSEVSDRTPWTYLLNNLVALHQVFKLKYSYDTCSFACIQFRILPWCWCYITHFLSVCSIDKTFWGIVTDYDNNNDNCIQPYTVKTGSSVMVYLPYCENLSTSGIQMN